MSPTLVRHCRTVAAAAALATAPHVAVATTPDEQAAICREADDRYQDMRGKDARPDAVPVVLMFKHTFCPPHLTVKQGSAVRFLNIDKRTSHSFWFRDAGREESERYFSGEGETMIMDLPAGDHTYLCGPHWEHQGMVGRITITP